MVVSESQLKEEISKYKKLYYASNRFHTYLDETKIVEEIIVTFEDLFSNYRFFLQQSLEINSLHKNTNKENEVNPIVKTFITGEIQVEQSRSKQSCILYVPLKGKHNVNGVIQVIGPNIVDFPVTDIEIITLLANTVGSAIENAKLYSKSKQVISDLQLINETTIELNSNLRLPETMKYLSNQIIQTFNAQEVGFFLLSKDRSKVRVLPGTTPFFLTKPSKIYVDLLEAKIHTENESIFIEDFNLQHINDLKKYRSIIAIPIIQSNNLKGFSIVMHQNPNFFSLEEFNLLQALLMHSSLALMNSLIQEELENMVKTDQLTKLHSRNSLDESIHYSMRDDNEGTFILMDIDNFKEINDTFGHQVGDDVIIQVAKLIQKNIRGNDVGARWGGEELAIYLPKVSMDEGLVIAERLVKTVADCTFPKVTVSCGVSYWNKDRQDTYNYLFKRADEALYLAKSTGKNKVVAQKTA
ncbi:diguanylate cyclase [Bacillus sp. OK048]|uniref:sensor domain-containing diguanylate cyclase n=1 Tax=Bacillus sp. OK048 TaxID=1882761 RepID=UPI000881E288|nr:diguanylate cyclase [Bacillus sp. OK048]SDM27124.1 diguanylate cyclase (GGDEF) domain-containing protein [Bacillus sp. OK048]